MHHRTRVVSRDRSRPRNEDDSHRRRQCELLPPSSCSRSPCPRGRTSRTPMKSSRPRSPEIKIKKVENATAVIWKTLLIAEKTFRRLDAPELLADVARGEVYVNGVRASRSQFAMVKSNG